MNPHETLHPALIALGCAALLAAPLAAQPPPGEATGIPEDAPAVVTGQIRFMDELIRLPPRPVTTQKDVCGLLAKPNRGLEVGADRGLANVVVVVEGSGLDQIERELPEPVVDQVECEFLPHVQVALFGTEVRLKNSVPVLHNVHAYGMRSHRSPFNVGMPPESPDLFEKLDLPEPLVLRCDAGHRWMRAFVFVSRSPFFALTDAAGRFRIEGLPPGRYTLRLWHELLGESTGRIKLEGGQNLDLPVEAHHGRKLSFEIPRREGGPRVRMRAVRGGRELASLPTNPPTPTPTGPPRPRPAPPRRVPAYPPWMMALWATGVVGAAGALVVLQRRKAAGDEATGEEAASEADGGDASA